jgi:hypothetical protein
MDLRRIKSFTMALGLVAASSMAAKAAPITFTGNVELDMPSPSKNVTLVPGHPVGYIAQDPASTAAGYVSGWLMKDLRFSYDKGTDTLSVGVNTYSTAGNPTGNPNASYPTLGQQGGSITVAFAADGASPTIHGSPLVVAGVPADTKQAGTGIDGFNVASYQGSNSGIAYSYGTTLSNNIGALAFNPTNAHPDFEFTIKNFSTIPGLDPTKGFWIQAFAGSGFDVVAGEDTLGWLRIPAIAAQQVVPEPSTIAAWSLLAAGAVIGIRRKRRTEIQA